jgi:hypothetical protein
MSAPREHALLSASGAYRWLNCPPSARLEENTPEESSEYANEGRLAHEIAELKLTKHFTPMSPKTFSKKLQVLKAKPRYDAEMLGYTDDYLEYIQQLAHSFAAQPYVTIEKRVNYSHIAPEGFGTADCIIIGGNVLHIVDLKYGKGVPVSATHNPQMMLYALGALAEYSMLYAIDEVAMHIVQPRLGEPSSWAIPAADLWAWGQKVKPIAQTAFDGKGEFCAGEWCKFCRAKATCRARSNNMTALEAFGGKKPPLISNEEVGDILIRAQTLKAWVSDLEEYALTELLKGEEIPGWKAVEGRSIRQFEDTDKAFKQIIKAGYDEALLYERKPITLTAVEKLLKKKQFNELLGQYVIKPPGKPTLATETDKREAITVKTTAEEAFAQKAS